MKARDFFLQVVAVAIGSLIAMAIAGVYLKSQLSATAGSNTTLGAILSLFGSKPAGSS